MDIQSLIHKESKSIISIVGATCTGKTGLSIKLAQEHGLEIVNADSRLIFTGMDIGTAKPDEKEMAGIKHHLIDIREPDQIYSSGEYRQDFDRLMQQNFGQEPRCIVVGGTGMYLRAALEDLDMPEYASDMDLRAELESKDLSELQKMLEDLDSEALEMIDINNKRRLSRAIEVSKLSGHKFSELRKKSPKDRYDVLWIGINYEDRDKLYERINLRVHQMIDMGLIKEVEDLVRNYGFSQTMMGTIGYKEICLYLQGDMKKDDAIAMIQKRTRNYAKRQITWFKSNKRINWISA